jgi:Protein of unknown function (DUF3465)
MRKPFAFIALLAVVYALFLQHGTLRHESPEGGAAESDPTVAQAEPRANSNCNGDLLAAALRNHQSHVEVCGRGVVARVLRDDLQGSRHQRFIVRVPSGQTILVAYNIDIAPRIEGLRTGASLEFAGEYEWNGQGGVVHWTHHDPGGRHAAGWLKYEGRTYQ